MLDDSIIDINNIFNQNLQDFVCNFPNEIIKNELVWNYKNTKGLCNLSSLMFAQYMIFIDEHIDELIECANQIDKISNIFKKSYMSDVNEALYYGQTILALVLYTKQALSYDSNIKSIIHDHPFTHFNSLSDIEPNINYIEKYNNIIETNVYIINNKKHIIDDYISNNIGFFKVRESKHACFLYLNESKAVYINNSLFSKYPLVCDKSDLTSIWISLRRWNKEKIDDINFDSISLFDVIYGFQKINKDILLDNLSRYISNNINGGLLTSSSINNQKYDNYKSKMVFNWLKSTHITTFVFIILVIAIIVTHFMCLGLSDKYKEWFHNTFSYIDKNNH